MEQNKALYCGKCGSKLVRFQRGSSKPEVACLCCFACGDMAEVEERSAGLLTGELTAEQAEQIRAQMRDKET